MGIINAYTPIESIYSADDNNVDSLIVGDAALFDVGDTVMVYCVQGARSQHTVIWGDEIGRDAQQPRNTGKYAFLIIDEIDVPTRHGGIELYRQAHISLWVRVKWPN